MKELHLVVFSHISHPYLNLLYDELDKYGVKTSFKYPSLMNFFRISLDFLSMKHSRLIHIHWVEHCTRNTKALYTAVKTLFLVKWILFMKLTGRKTIITLHNIVPHEEVHPRIEHVTFRLSTRLADAIIVHNAFAKKMAERLYNVAAKKIHIIPHGNFISYYPNSISRREAREILKIPQEKTVMLFFGHIRRYKGLSVLLQAFEQAFRENPDLFLLVAGRCHDRDLEYQLKVFQQQNKKNMLAILEYIASDQIQVFMNTADFGVLPYLKVTTTGSMILFMSFGKPLIIPKIPQVIDAGEKYFSVFFKKNDSESLRKAILQVANYKDLPLMGNRAFETAKGFDWREIAGSTFSLYTGL